VPADEPAGAKDKSWRLVKLDQPQDRQPLLDYEG
jgi:hypothetical protein